MVSVCANFQDKRPTEMSNENGKRVAWDGNMAANDRNEGEMTKMKHCSTRGDSQRRTKEPSEAAAYMAAELAEWSASDATCNCNVLLKVIYCSDRPRKSHFFSFQFFDILAFGQI